MPTPRRGYFLQDGTKVPSVTTIIGRFKEAGPLMHWAWECGANGKDYRKERDKAASIGSIAHEMVDCYIHQRTFDKTPYDPALIEHAQKPFSAFLEWANSTHLKPIETEIQLLSEQHRFGGTPDAMLVKGKLSLGDWKTSNRIYGEYLIQLAAYGILWEENFPDRPIEGGYHLIRFAKEYGDFTHYWFPELTAAKEAFLLMRRLYTLDSELKKRAA